MFVCRKPALRIAAFLSKIPDAVDLEVKCCPKSCLLWSRLANIFDGWRFAFSGQRGCSLLGGVFSYCCYLLIPMLFVLGVGLSVGEGSNREDAVCSICSILVENLMPPFSIVIGERYFGLEFDPSRDDCY